MAKAAEEGTAPKAQQLPPRHELVAVPRAALTKYRDVTFTELRAAAVRGDDGLFLTNSRDFGISYFRQGDKGGHLHAEDAPSLYCEGWVKAS